MSHENPVLLAPDRWQSLTARVGAERFGLETGDLEQITLDGPIEVDGILFLPAVYRAA